MTTATLLPAARKRTLRGTWVARLLGVLAVSSVLITTWAWVSAGGIERVIDPTKSVGSIALYAGLLASNLMILQVLYMARIPWVERAWGHDVLARRHRLLGFWSFWLMITHVILLAVNQLGRKPDQPLNALWNLFVAGNWMLLTSIGTAMIILVVVTSIRVARRKLKYESWHLIHLYAYLGMGLALPHQLFSGRYLQPAWAQTYWWVLYLLALAAVLAFRVLYPLWISWYHRLRVAEVTTAGPGVSAISMVGRHLDRLGTKSGQFFIWRFLGGTGWTRGHPFTISAAPHPERFRITVQMAGEGSARAVSIRPGTRVLIEGPYGLLTSDVRRHPRMVLFAAGVGITPFVGMLADSEYEPGEATLIYRVRSADHAIHLDELHDLVDRRGYELTLLSGSRRASDSWLPAGGADDDVTALQHLVPDIARCDVFICGPAEWSASLQETLRRAGVSRRDIHIEDFSW